MDRFSINRDVWERGPGSSLLRKTKFGRQQCCVGIYLTALGVPDEDLLEKQTAKEIEEIGKLPEAAAWLVDQNRTGPEDTGIAMEIYEENDADHDFDEDPDEAEDVRELRIVELFKQGANITVDFSG